MATDILTARSDGPTPRYPHGVLGDAIEHAVLELSLSDGMQRRFILPQSLVFEDTAPRLADLDGDGRPEVLVVESSQTAGARLAVWDEDGRVTATPFIGRPFRWLAPLGAADLDGDGRTEIAYVDRPHLARILRIWRYHDRQLSRVTSAEGFSNHQIGWETIPGGIRACPGLPPEMVLADGAWTRVLALRLRPDGGLSQREVGAYAGPDSLTAALACP